MVDESSDSPRQIGETPFMFRILLSVSDAHTRDTLMASLKPEFAAINSKRVGLQVKISQHRIVFHLAAHDVTALRAAATSLMRLYSVADGVLKLKVKKNE